MRWRRPRGGRRPDRKREPAESADSLRAISDLRATASERGLALVLLRDDEPDGSVTLKPLFLGTEPQEDGMTALRMFDADGVLIELSAEKEDVRRVLDEPADWPEWDWLQY